MFLDHDFGRTSTVWSSVVRLKVRIEVLRIGLHKREP